MESGKILIAVWPEASAYNATYCLARALRQRGHEVVYAVPQRWQERVSQQGFETALLEISEPRVTESDGTWDRLRSILTGLRDAHRQIDVLCESLMPYRGLGFDLVLLHPTLWLSKLLQADTDCDQAVAVIESFLAVC